jgi:hypothetical protein
MACCICAAWNCERAWDQASTAAARLGFNVSIIAKGNVWFVSTTKTSVSSTSQKVRAGFEAVCITSKCMREYACCMGCAGARSLVEVNG